MCIYQKGKVQYFGFRWNGRRIQQSAQTTSRIAARQVESLARAALARADCGLIDATPPTLIRKVLAQAGYKVTNTEAPLLFGEFSAKFLEWVKAEHRAKPNTVRFYLERTGLLLKCPALKDVPVNRIDKSVVIQVKGWLARQHKHLVKRTRSGVVLVETSNYIGPAGINRALSVLRHMLYHAEDSGLIEHAPRARGLWRVKGEKPAERALTVAEEELYLSGAPQPLQDYAAVSIDTGFGPAEALSLRWRDVDFGLGAVRNRHEKAATRNRAVPMTRRIARVLSSRWEASGRPADGWVFSALNGRDAPLNYRSLMSQHKRLCARLQLPGLRLYDLRHTFATRLLLATGDIRAVQRLMGHANIATTVRYTHLTAERDREVIRAMESRAGKSELQDVAEHTAQQDSHASTVSPVVSS